MSANRSGKRFQGYFPAEVMAELEKRARESDRTLVAEVVRTLRHAWGIKEAEPADAPQPAAAPRPRGRPRKDASR